MCQIWKPHLFHCQSSVAQPEETSLTQRISEQSVFYLPRGSAQEHGVTPQEMLTPCSPPSCILSSCILALLAPSGVCSNPSNLWQKGRYVGTNIHMCMTCSPNTQNVIKVQNVSPQRKEIRANISPLLFKKIIQFLKETKQHMNLWGDVFHLGIFPQLTSTSFMKLNPSLAAIANGADGSDGLQEAKGDDSS